MTKEPLIPREVDLDEFLTIGIRAVFKKLMRDATARKTVSTLIGDMILYIHPSHLAQLHTNHPDLLSANFRDQVFRYKGIKVVPNNLASMPFISHLGITYDL